MQKFLITAGVILLVAGLLWPWIGKLGLGRLPGDISVEREGFRFYAPIMTCLIISVVVTVIFWLFRR